uniref:Uncharacterized protein n=1 Tax=viral metagenome TaxID=1070528 RepID=A0A6C0ERP2_9ZZZZ
MATSVGSTNLTTTNTWKLLEAINPDPSQSSTMAVYSNGTLVASGVTQSGTTTVTSPLFINGQGGTSTNSYPSYLAEMLVYNTAVSLSNRQLIEGYLAWKWGIQSSLPNTHPYYSAALTPSTASGGNLTIDTMGNIQVTPSNAFCITAPTEWRANIITVAGTSLIIPTPTSIITTTNSAALYSITNPGFNSLTLPTYTSSSPGVFWTIANSTVATLTISIVYTSGSGLGSTLTLAPGSSTNIYWNGSAFTSVSGGGGGGAITGTTTSGTVLLATGTSTGLQGSANLTFSNGSNLGIQTTTPATALDVNGGVTIRNGYRPSYSNVSSGTSLTVPSAAYGTHFNITTSSITGITLPTVVGSTDSNAYWVFRNNTAGYLSITFTYTTAGTTYPTNPVTIPPANSLTMMVTFPSSVLGYVLF